MSIREYWEAAVRGQKRGLGAVAFRAAMKLASAGQWVALQANLGVYRLGICRRVRLGCPVLVVGNLTLGGTGKSTTTAYVVKRLAARGIRAGVILRGYGRAAGGGPLLVSDATGILASPDRAGDEAVMLACLLPGHPVAVGVRRERVGRLLLRDAQADVLVLDDGFQYFRLARDADIVLVDASRPIETDRLFPAGTLREPHRHLKRATQVWITHAELVEPGRIQLLREWIARQAPSAPVVVSEHRSTGMRSLAGGPPPKPGEKVMALSALGNPRSFEVALREFGYTVEPLRLADHHRYVPSDWERIHAAAKTAGAGHVVTTEKDAIKLPAPIPEWPALHVLGCELAITHGHEMVDELIQATEAWLSERSTLSAAP